MGKRKIKKGPGGTEGRRPADRTRRLLGQGDHILGLQRFDGREQDVKDRIHALIQSSIEFDPETECMIYTGAWEENGQAKIRVGARVYCVSRVVAWLYHEGFQLWGLERAVRKCNSPACCNGEHVEVVKNQAEAMSKLRRSGKV